MWEIGRSANPKSPYFKYCVFISKLLKMDIYILKYPKGSRIDWHYDQVPKGYQHHRLNIILKKAKGGDFLIRKVEKVPNSFIDRKGHGRVAYLLTTTRTTDTIHKGRMNLFRPDIQKHAVSEIKSGTRYVLSIGWLVKE